MWLFCRYLHNIVMEDEIIKKNEGKVESEISTALQSLSMSKIKLFLSV